MAGVARDGDGAPGARARGATYLRDIARARVPCNYIVAAAERVARLSSHSAGKYGQHMTQNSYMASHLLPRAHA